MAPPSFPQLTVNLPETPFTLPPSQADVSRIAATTDPSRILVDAFDTLIDPPPVLVCGSVRLDVFTSLSSSIARKLTVELVGVEKENHPKTAGYIKQILREHIVLWEAPRGRTVDPRIVLEPEALDETRASPAPDSDVQDERPDGVENMDAASSGHDHASINSDGTTGGEVDLRHKELTVGSHEFPFTFAVPADIPPTVRVHHGAAADTISFVNR
ncbi:hypothetical protein HK104_010933 [Borealophlyctis nickersoniae]|nr:hypothetical protein HK104_010933 [Borealophlyctis nickersoniae]